MFRTTFNWWHCRSLNAPHCPLGGHPSSPATPKQLASITRPSPQATHARPITTAPPASSPGRLLAVPDFATDRAALEQIFADRAR